MKLSKTLLTILTPVATVATVAPIASCSKPLVINFGESVNCLSKDSKYKEIAKYHKADEVYQYAKQNCKWVNPGTEVDIDEINSESTFSQMYFDLMCSLHVQDLFYCLELDWRPEDNKFTNFNIHYQHHDKDGKKDGEIETHSCGEVIKDNFKYIAGGDGSDKVWIEVGLNSSYKIPSYSYQEAIIEQE